MTEKVTAWLAGFSEDALHAGEGWAVFPQGEKALSLTRDILGGEKARKRLTFLVVRHSHAPAGTELEEFARWAKETAPLLGEDQTLRVEDARQTARGKDGPGRYEAKLIFEFTV